MKTAYNCLQPPLTVSFLRSKVLKTFSQMHSVFSFPWGDKVAGSTYKIKVLCILITRLFARSLQDQDSELNGRKHSLT